MFVNRQQSCVPGRDRSACIPTFSAASKVVHSERAAVAQVLDNSGYICAGVGAKEWRETISTHGVIEDGDQKKKPALADMYEKKVLTSTGARLEAGIRRKTQREGSTASLLLLLLIETHSSYGHD